MRIICVAFFLLNSCITFGQLSKNETGQLEELCKVWGLLKYYHPNVAAGNVNWDSVLVNTIPKARSAKNQNEFNSVVDELLISAGQLSTCDTCKPFDKNLVTFINRDWINKGAFSFEAKNTLLKLSQSTTRGSNPYVTNKWTDGRSELAFPRFTENAYPEMKFPDVNYRLLSLFRIWNTINYFFPYKDMMDTNWDITLVNFIPRFMSVTDTLQYHLLPAQLMTYLNDGHAFANSAIFNNHFYKYRSPFEVMYVEDKFILSKSLNDSLCRLTNLKAGDIITAIDGMPVDKRKQELAKYFGGSNKQAINGVAIAEVLLNSSDSIGSITIIRSGKEFNFSLPRYKYGVIHAKDESMKTPIWKKLNPDVVYVHMGNLTKRDSVAKLFEVMKDTKTMILDFRYYPEFSVMYKFLSYVYKENQPFAKYLSFAFKQPGYFNYTFDGFGFFPLQPKAYEGKIILLVNEQSSSLGEFFPMALQLLKNTITIGSQTWGGDGNQVGISLPGGINVGFSGLGVFYPDGSVCQRKGLKIDMEVHPTIQAIREGRDELLEKALKVAAGN